MPRKTPPFDRWPEWTTARFFGFLRSGLREKFNRYPPKYESIKRAAITVQDGHYKTGAKKDQPKYKKQYQCSECKDYFIQKDIQVDHIVPAGSLKSFDDLVTFADRLFCGVDGLQVMCKPCHSTKTKQEKSNGK